jgi:16S rRNA (cytosine967-C5)-methyltransferase
MNDRRTRGSRPSGQSKRGQVPPPVISQNDARYRVHERLIKLTQRFPDLPLGSADTRGLSPRDAAFARALESAILERWITLETVLSSQIDRRWETLQPAVRAALLTGAAELLLLDGIPDHAAINESVNRVRQHVHQAAAGLVNAVLRKVARLRKDTLPAEHPDAQAFHERRDLLPLSDGRALVLDQPIFAEEQVLRLEQQTSHGEDLVVHWIGAHGMAKTRDLCRHDLVRPPICITADDPEEIRPEAEEDGPLSPHDRAGFFVFNPRRAGIERFLEAYPHSRVQDPASAESVAGAYALKPKRILDFCAGRGTKTRQLAHAFPDAMILATDVDAVRYADLERCFADHPTIEVLRPEQLSKAIGLVDLLMLDVPCTNTGVLPRRPEAKYRFSRESLASIATLQRKIVREAEPFLAPGGAILFSTCSLEPAENRRMVTWMERRFGLDCRNAAQRFPAGMPGDPPARIHDGSFHAVLLKSNRPGTTDADFMEDSELDLQIPASGEFSTIPGDPTPDIA